MPVAGAVRCVDCGHFRLKDAKDMAKFGFGLCALKKNGHEFMSATYPRECKQWVIAADDAPLAARHGLKRGGLTVSNVVRYRRAACSPPAARGGIDSAQKGREGA